MRAGMFALLAASCLSSSLAVSQERVIRFWPNREPMNMGTQIPVDHQEPLEIELSLPTTFGLTVGQPVALGVSTEGNANGVTYRAAASAAMPGLTVNSSTGSIAGVPDAPAGAAYSIAVEGVRSGNVVATTDVVSRVLRDSIDIDVVPEGMYLAAGEPFPSDGLVAGATGGDQDTITWSLQNAPEWLAVVTVGPGGGMLQQQSGMNVIETSPTTVTLVASDAEGREDTETFTVEVVTASIALNVPSPFGLTVGQDVSLTMATADSFGDVTYAAGDDAIMDGLSVDALTGAVTGQPTAPAGTAYHIVVDAIRSGARIASTVLDRVSRDPISVTAPEDGPSWLTIEPTGPGIAQLQQLDGTEIAQPGSWSVTVVAEDAEGRIDASGTFDVIVAPALLAFDVSNSFGLTTGQAISLQLAGTLDLDGVTYRASPDAVASGLIVNPATGMVSGIPSAAAGTEYSILVEAIVDDTVVATASLNRTLREPLSVTVGPDDMNLVAGDDFPTEGIQVATTGGDRQSFNWSLSNAPSWLTIESSGDGTAVLKQVSGQPITEVANLTATVNVVDSEGREASKSFVVNVELIDEIAPTWQTAPSLPDALSTSLSDAPTTSPYTTSVAASDASGSVTYSVVDAEPIFLGYNTETGVLWMEGLGQASLDPDTGELSGKTTNAAGIYTITVRATDPSGNFSDRKFSLRVNDGIPPVWITSPALPAGTEGEAYATAVVANDETALAGYALYGPAPGWVAVSNSGQVTGIPASSGTHSFTVRASDENGNSIDRQFTVEIEAAPDACESGPVGTVCSDGAIYAGDSDGTRIYVAPQDESGHFQQDAAMQACASKPAAGQWRLPTNEQYLELLWEFFGEDTCWFDVQFPEPEDGKIPDVYIDKMVCKLPKPGGEISCKGVKVKIDPTDELLVRCIRN
jgi:hypothetical protein